MAAFDPMRAPDYARQVVSDRPVGPMFEDLSKRQPDHGKQGDSSTAVGAGDDDLEFGRRGRFSREPSGATGARSSSVSRDRSTVRSERDSSLDSSYSSNVREVAAYPSAAGSHRNSSLSPTRAMGARSVSRERSNANTSAVSGGGGDGLTRQRSRLDTLEGIGSAAGPLVNSAALDSGMGFGSRGRTWQAQDMHPDDAADMREGRSRGNDGSRSSSNRFVSPSRAMGARSMNASM